jgi:hypothetical protein
MKRITNIPGLVNARTVNNVCKKGFSNNKVIAYKRRSPIGEEEWAFLRRTGLTSVGWISLIGGATYQPAFVYNNYKASLSAAAMLRKVYEFKNHQDFLDTKDVL